MGHRTRQPLRGFRVSERVAHLLDKYGGWLKVAAACHTCEVNTRRLVGPNGLAGCAGFFYLSPDPESPAIEQFFQAAIKRHRLEARWQQAFVPTQPLWFGFWLNSPLVSAQCELLYLIFSEGQTQTWLAASANLQPFLAALKSAVDWELNLHVSLAPPGHTDLGYYTVFPHCPRCKVSSMHHISQTVRCRMCGAAFDPSQTPPLEPPDIQRILKSLPVDELGLSDSLKQRLAQDADLARRFLTQCPHWKTGYESTTSFDLSQSAVCKVCGQPYIPETTESEERWDRSPTFGEDAPLEALLGEKYEAFIRKYRQRQAALDLEQFRAQLKKGGFEPLFNKIGAYLKDLGDDIVENISAQSILYWYQNLRLVLITVKEQSLDVEVDLVNEQGQKFGYEILRLKNGSQDCSALLRKIEGSYQNLRRRQRRDD